MENANQTGKRKLTMKAANKFARPWGKHQKNSSLDAVQYPLTLSWIIDPNLTTPKRRHAAIVQLRISGDGVFSINRQFHPKFGLAVNAAEAPRQGGGCGFLGAEHGAHAGNRPAFVPEPWQSGTQHMLCFCIANLAEYKVILSTQLCR